MGHTTPPAEAAAGRRGRPGGAQPRRRLAILGSTGSLGQQALAICQRFPDRLEVAALAASGRRWEVLAEQSRTFSPRLVAVADPEAARRLRSELDGPGSPQIADGPDALVQAALYPEADLVMMLTVGLAGLRPTLAALEAGRRVALANKEVLVAAGPLLRARARLEAGQLIPVDSEHSAIWQSLWGEQTSWVHRLWLTASGGPFWGWSREQLASVTPQQALAHPTWRMGPRISVDSATLVNKGFEVIEAHHLFGLPVPDIRVVIHRQSVVHSLVELRDGSCRAQLSWPDMRLPLLLAMSYPERWPFPDVTRLLDPPEPLELSFEPAGEEPAGVRLAREAAASGPTHPAVLAAADEVAVEAFLQGQLPFTGILEVAEQALAAHRAPPGPLTLEALLEADRWARQEAARHVRALLAGRL